MGFKKWLKGATQIRFDDRTLGNVIRNAATGAGAVVGGPAGALIAGGGSALGAGVQKGANFGDIVKSGLTGAGTATALNSASGFLKNAATGGSAPSAVSGAAPLDSSSALDALPTDLPSVGTTPTALPSLPGSVPPVKPPPGAFKSALNATGSFIAKNPTAAGMGLSAVGNLATAGTENRMNEAQARLLEQRAGETEYDFEQRKKRDAALAPLWSQLGSTFRSNYDGLAKNPYVPQAV